MIDNKILIIAIIFVVMYLLYRNNCSINEGFKLENKLGNKVMEQIKDNKINCKCRCNDAGSNNIGGNPDTWTPGSRIHHMEEQEHCLIGGNPETWTPGSRIHHMEEKVIGGNPETWTPGSRIHHMEEKVIGGNPETWTPGSRIHHMEEQEHGLIGGNPDTWTPGSRIHHMEEQEHGLIGGNPETWTPGSRVHHMEEQEHSLIGGNPCTWTPGSRVHHMEEQEHGLIGGNPETWTPGSNIHHMEEKVIGSDHETWTPSGIMEEENNDHFPFGADPHTWTPGAMQESEAEEESKSINPRCFSIEKEGDLKGYYKMVPKRHNYISKIDGSTVISQGQDEQYNICHTCEDGKNCNCNEETRLGYITSLPAEKEIRNVISKGKKINKMKEVDFRNCTFKQNSQCPEGYSLDPTDSNFCIASFTLSDKK